MIYFVTVLLICLYGVTLDRFVSKERKKINGIVCNTRERGGERGGEGGGGGKRCCYGWHVCICMCVCARALCVYMWIIQKTNRQLRELRRYSKQDVKKKRKKEKGTGK